MFIADHCILDPVVQSLLAVKFDIKRIKDCTEKTDDISVMRVCIDRKAILITLDRGMSSQAYYYQFSKNGLSIILLRWKHQTYLDWQQMVQVILRDHNLWGKAVKIDPSMISVSFTRGTRVRPWSKVPSLISLQAPKQGFLQLK
jgi:hypothetical protein